MSLSNRTLETSGDITLSTDYVNATTIIDSLTGTNFTAVKAQLDALAYDPVGIAINVQEEHALEDREEIFADNCGLGTIDVSVIKTPTVQRQWGEMDNLPVISKLMGIDTATEAGGVLTYDNVNEFPIVFTDADIGFVIPQNADGTKPTITGINTQSDGLGTASVEGTDFEIKKVGSVRYIFIIDGGNMSVGPTYYFLGSIVQPAGEFLGYNIERTTLPFSLIKFDSCYQEYPEFDSFGTLLWLTPGVPEKKKDVAYFVKMTPNESLIRAYTNRAENEFAYQQFSMIGEKGGMYLLFKERALV